MGSGELHTHKASGTVLLMINQSFRILHPPRHQDLQAYWDQP